MKRLAVAIIHGIGSEKEFYSIELKHRIVEEYVKADPNNRMEDDLLFHEIYWGDLVKDQHGELLETLDYKKELTYNGVRNLFIDYMRLGLSYREDSSCGLYQNIHNRIKESMSKFASHRNVDVDNTPLVIMAHSFGSVIASNYIRDIQASGAGNSFEGFNTLAGVITFASPLGVYIHQGQDIPPITKVGKDLTEGLVDRVKWLNFYDKDDVIAFPLRNANEAYKNAVDGDFEINVGSAATSWNPGCHTGYWEDKDFYKPVAKYLGEIRAPHDFWKLS